MEPFTLIGMGLSVLPKLPDLWGKIAGIFGKETPKTVEKAGELAGDLLGMLKKGEISPEIQAQMAAEFNRHEERIMEISAAQEKAAQENLTERHKADMGSDSWLSKNIRPLVLSVLTINIVAATYFSVDAVKFTALVELLLVVFGYYFIGRTVEKDTVARIVGAMRK